MKNKITVDDKLIADLSRLAKLKFDKESSERMKSDLKTILGFVDSLSKIDTEGIEPLVYMSEEVNVLRADEISNIVSQENALKNAPHTVDIVTAEEWNHTYSRQKAAYPLPFVREQKFWPAVSRIDSAYGDRNLMCSCLPLEAYAEAEA